MLLYCSVGHLAAHLAPGEGNQSLVAVVVSTAAGPVGGCEVSSQQRRSACFSKSRRNPWQLAVLKSLDTYSWQQLALRIAA